MKKYSLSGARIAQLCWIAFVLLGFSQTVQAGPTSTSSDYSVAVFANSPSTSITNPDSITSFQGTVWVGYQNGSTPTGGGSSDIVQFDPTGKALKTYKLNGRNDGLKYNPFDGKIYALQNEDANPYLVLIDPVTGTMTKYNYSAPPLHGGGYDDIVFLNGQICSLKGVFRVSRTGDVSQALQVFLNVNDNSSADQSSSNTQKSVTIPIGASSATVAVALDSKSDFKEDGSKQSVVVSIQPDPNYQVQPVNLQTGVQVLTLPLPK